MADDEAFSHVARVSGRPIVLDRLVANQAAIQCTGPPTERHNVLKGFVSSFMGFLRDGSDSDFADKERRRKVLLMVTESRSQTGVSERDSDAIAKVAMEIHRSCG